MFHYAGQIGKQGINHNKENGVRKPRLSAQRHLAAPHWPQWLHCDRSFGIQPVGSDMLLIAPTIIADFSRKEL